MRARRSPVCRSTATWRPPDNGAGAPRRPPRSVSSSIAVCDGTPPSAILRTMTSAAGSRPISISGRSPSTRSSPASRRASAGRTRGSARSPRESGRGGGGWSRTPRRSSICSSPGASSPISTAPRWRGTIVTRRCRSGRSRPSPGTSAIRGSISTPSPSWRRRAPTIRSGTPPSGSCSPPGGSTATCACSGARRSWSGPRARGRRSPGCSSSTAAGRSTGATRTRTPGSPGASAASTVRRGRSAPSSERCAT